MTAPLDVTERWIEILVEEPSAKALLQVLAPRIVPDVTVNIHEHNGKQALLKRLPRRLQGYRSFIGDHGRVVVLVDQDRDDCRLLKQYLETEAAQAGFLTRSTEPAGAYHVVNRIAIEELEAWYLGDWAAIQTAFPGVRQRSPHPDPDAIQGGTKEAFTRVLHESGHYKGRLPQIEVARAIAPHMDPARNISRSFQVFRDALRDLGSAP